MEGVSGALGGVLSLAITYPLLLVSTRQQTRQTPLQPEPLHESRVRPWVSCLTELYAGLGAASAVRDV